MAIQIWDAQAGQYKSADLARFGGAGTLTEALVWDGTQYVKVWPTTAPSIYPVSGGWGPVAIGSFQSALVAEHTLVESGNYTVTLNSVTSAYSLNIGIDGVAASGTTKGPKAATWTTDLQIGTRVTFGVTAYPSGTFHGSWSLVKN